MRAHVIMTGHARSFARCWANLRWHVIARLPSPVIHASLNPDDDGERAREILQSSGISHRFRFVAQPPPDAFQYYGDAHLHAPYAISVAPYAIHAQLWRMSDGYMTAHPEIGERDIVVRLRPDLWFHERIDIGECDLNLPGSVNHPWWGNFGGINDRFAIMPARQAHAYFTCADAGEAIDAGCPFHPESLLAYACRTAPKKRCNFLFSTIRADGKQRWPEVLPGEIPPNRHL